MNKLNQLDGFGLGENATFEQKWIAYNRRRAFIYDPIGAVALASEDRGNLRKVMKIHRSTDGIGAGRSSGLEEWNLVDAGICNNCHRTGDLMCSRCSSSYCSAACQIADWNNHRFKCVPKSPHYMDRQRTMDKHFYRSEVENILSIEALKYDSSVVITHVYNQQVVYVRLATDEANKSFAKTMKDIEEYSQAMIPIETGWEMEQIALVLYKNKCYRAMVLSMYDTGPLIVARIDVGDVIQVPPSKLFHLSDELKSRPAHVRRVVLKGLSNVQGKWKQMMYLMKLLDNETELISKYNGVECDLYVKETGQYVNEHILTMSKEASTVDADEKDDLEAHRNVEEIIQFKQIWGFDVKMIVLDNSMLNYGYISCMQVGDIDGWLDMNEAIEEYCRKSPVSTHSPKLHEVCLAYCQAENRWLRAVCLDVQFFLVLFLDRGNVQRIVAKDIKPMPAHFAKFPCCTVFCMIEGLHEAINSPDKKIKTSFGQTKDKLRRHFEIYQKMVFEVVKFEENQICQCKLIF